VDTNSNTIGDSTLHRILTSSDLPCDYLFIDTAPTYDNIVLSALNAADIIFAPVAFSRFDYKGALFYEAQLNRETEKLSAWRILFNFHSPRAILQFSSAFLDHRLSECEALGRI